MQINNFIQLKHEKLIRIKTMKMFSGNLFLVSLWYIVFFFCTK